MLGYVVWGGGYVGIRVGSIMTRSNVKICPNYKGVLVPWTGT